MGSCAISAGTPDSKCVRGLTGASGGISAAADSAPNSRSSGVTGDDVGLLGNTLGAGEERIERHPSFSQPHRGEGVHRCGRFARRASLKRLSSNRGHLRRWRSSRRCAEARRGFGTRARPLSGRSSPVDWASKRVAPGAQFGVITTTELAGRRITLSFFQS